MRPTAAATDGGRAGKSRSARSLPLLVMPGRQPPEVLAYPRWHSDKGFSANIGPWPVLRRHRHRALSYHSCKEDAVNQFHISDCASKELRRLIPRFGLTLLVFLSTTVCIGLIAKICRPFTWYVWLLLPLYVLNSVPLFYLAVQFGAILIEVFRLFGFDPFPIAPPDTAARRRKGARRTSSRKP